LPRIGAHVNGGLKGGVARALEIGAEALQIFIGSPQSWRPPNPQPKEIAGFRQGVAEHRLGPVFVHGLYLINLGAGREEVYEKSVASLAAQLRLADRAGAAGLIFHPGSAGSATFEEALPRVVAALERVLDGYAGAARLVLEVCAGQGQTIGDRFEELQAILAALGNDPRLAICWDTCHLFNAGYDIATADGLERTVAEFDRLIGLDRLIVVHANDSKSPLGSNVDRHENIGRGHIGEAAFARMLHHLALRDLPWILEVPGYDNEGPDRPNVETLRRLAA
jgi:deoxyribonuclease-4